MPASSFIIVIPTTRAYKPSESSCLAHTLQGHSNTMKHTSLLPVIFFLICSTVRAWPSGPSSGCDDPEWQSYQGKCYRIIGTVGRFGDSDTYCNMLRGRTLTIASADEQAFVERFLFDSVAENIWLGGTRSNNKFQWRNDGTMIEKDVYANWAEGSPSDNKAKACMVMLSSSDDQPGKWSDEFCQSSAMIVCERADKKATPVPEVPATTKKPSKPVVVQTTPRPSKPEATTAKPCERVCSEDLDKLKNDLEVKINRLANIVKQQEVYIEDLSDQVLQLSQSQVDSQQVEQNTKKIQRIANRVHAIDADLLEISQNFTGVAKVFDFLGDEIYDLQGKIKDIQSSGGGSTDLNGVKVEMKNYINNEINNLDVITNAKLEYVNYRRALMVERKNRWTTLGYV